MTIQLLFVHGMGRSPISGWPMLWRLQRAGLKTATFGYDASRDDFSGISNRLVLQISRLAAQGDYVLVGHSLGGVLLRAALNSLPAGTRPPCRLFLVGSPVAPARLAKILRGNPLYRLLTRDCSQLLASERRMAEFGPTATPTTAIVGTLGFSSRRGPFGSETNDGVVSASEVAAQWISDTVEIPVVHTLLPASRLVAEIILQRLAVSGDLPRRRPNSNN